MPAPTNTSPATAVEILSLPYSVMQTVDDAGTTYDVWYKYTAVTGETMIGVFGFGDLVTYRPSTASSDDVGVSFQVTGDENDAIQVPVTAGTTYYLKFTTNSGNPTPAVLTLSVITGPASSYAVGSIAVNDDTDGFPLVLISSVNGDDEHVLSVVSPFPAGEAGDVLSDSGVSLWMDVTAGDMKLYDSSFTQIGTVALDIGSDISLRANQGEQLFYVGVADTPSVIYTVDSAGAIGGTTWSIGNVSLAGIAAANDGSVLYYAQETVTAAIQRWDLVADMALSNLVAGVTNYRVSDILVMPDDTIVVLYYNSGLGNAIIKNIDADGTILTTYSTITTTFPGGTFPRLAYAIDDESFWVWFHPDTGVSQFRNMRLSDGVSLADVVYTEYEQGVNQQDPAASPTSRFGISFSCPFLVIRAGGGGGGGGGGDGDDQTDISGRTETRLIRRMRRATHLSSENLRQFFSKFELEFQRGVGLTAGQGSDPQIMLRWSDDGGMTWSNEYWTTAGALGQYGTRAIWRRLGMGRDRIFEISMSDPVLWAIIDAYLDVDLGTN